MGFTLVNQQFSFVRFSESDSDIQLPVLSESDIAFQFSLLYDSVQAADATMSAAPSSLKLLVLAGENNNIADIIMNTVRNLTDQDGLNFERYRTGDQQITFVWRHGIFHIDNYLNCDACFQFAVTGLFEDGQTPGTSAMVSNAFHYSCFESQPTSLLEYSCEENSMGFIYCNTNDFKNKIRLPLWIRKPQFEDEETVNFDSSGYADVLKSVSRKTFEGAVDYLTEALHERVRVALAHDYLRIESERYSGQIRKNGNYEIEWPEIDSIIEATAKFKVYANPYLVRNNNCATC